MKIGFGRVILAIELAMVVLFVIVTAMVGVEHYDWVLAAILALNMGALIGGRIWWVLSQDEFPNEQ